MMLQRRWWAWFLAAVVLAVVVAGCATRVTKENFDKIHTGMTQAQVQAILGEPTESSSVDLPVFSGTSSTWRAGDTSITIQFVNGKVVAKQFNKPAR
jgi:outer membrane protein assembly factor BamE (lipoprotein component of BamABCDE complex)